MTGLLRIVKNSAVKKLIACTSVWILYSTCNSILYLLNFLAFIIAKSSVCGLGVTGKFLPFYHSRSIFLSSVKLFLTALPSHGFQERQAAGQPLWGRPAAFLAALSRQPIKSVLMPLPQICCVPSGACFRLPYQQDTILFRSFHRKVRKKYHAPRIKYFENSSLPRE